jgi:hypothetical protein
MFDILDAHAVGMMNQLVPSRIGFGASSTSAPIVGR